MKKSPGILVFRLSQRLVRADFNPRGTVGLLPRGDLLQPELQQIGSLVSWRGYSGSYAATSFVGCTTDIPISAISSSTCRVKRPSSSDRVTSQIDICRILAKSADECERRISQHIALDALAESRIREIHLIGRRGPVQARFTTQRVARTR